MPKQFLDLNGLETYDGLIKGTIPTRMSQLDNDVTMLKESFSATQPTGQATGDVWTELIVEN